MQAKKLSYQPLHPVAPYSTFYFTANSYTHARYSEVIGPDNDDKVLRCNTLA